MVIQKMKMKAEYQYSQNDTAAAVGEEAENYSHLSAHWNYHSLQLIVVVPWRQMIQ